MKFGPVDPFLWIRSGTIWRLLWPFDQYSPDDMALFTDKISNIAEAAKDKATVLTSRLG